MVLNGQSKILGVWYGVLYYAGENFQLQLFGDTVGWKFGLDVGFVYDVMINLGFFKTMQMIHAMIGVDVSKIRAVESIDVDTMVDPVVLMFKKIYVLIFDFDFMVKTSISIVNTI